MTFTIDIAPIGRSMNITLIHSDFPGRPRVQLFATRDPLRALYYAIEKVRDMGFTSSIDSNLRRIGTTTLSVVLNDGVV
jgi:hypothetical protein